jgi:uncharacterized membrane protein
MAEARGKTGRRRPVLQRLRKMRDKGLEATMIAAGIVLLLLVTAEGILLTVLHPSVGIALWRELAVEITVGREASFPIALDGHVPPLLLVQVSFTQDIGLFCVLFPVFLRVMQRFQRRDNWIMRRLRRIQVAAGRRSHVARRWGPVGIFVFMLVPFLVNGPIIGGAMGRLAGMPTKSLLIPVFASTVVAAFAWTYFYDALLGWAGHLHPALPFILTGCIVGALVSWLLLDEWLEARRAARLARK